MVTYSIVNQTPSRLLFFQKRYQTGPGHEQEANVPLPGVLCPESMQIPVLCLSLTAHTTGDNAAPLDMGNYALLLHHLSLGSK